MSAQLAELVEAGVHFGHQTKRWNPKMKPFILESRNQIHILNLNETVKQIDVAAEFLAELARKGKRILFVGCKRQAQEAVREAAEAAAPRPSAQSTAAIRFLPRWKIVIVLAPGLLATTPRAVREPSKSE